MSTETSSPQPAPSRAWGRRVPPGPGDSAILAGRTDAAAEAGELRARLLKLIVAREQARKADAK